MENIKRTLLITIICLIPFICYAVKMTDFTEDTSPTSDDLIWTTNNPSGTPSDRKVSLGNLLLWMATQDNTFTGTNTFSEVTNFKGNGSSTTGKTCYYDTPGTGYVCIQAPETIDTDFNITIPSSLPATNLPLGISSEGVIYPSSSFSGMSVTGGTNYALGVWDSNTPAVLDSLDTGEAGQILQSGGSSSLPSWTYNSASLTGTHASPSTTNPLSPTWTTAMHMVWYGTTGEIDLPAVSGYTGRGIIIYNTGAYTITIDPNGSEIIVRDGTVQSGGVSITLSSGAGNYVSLFCDGVRWITLGYKGTLAEGS